MPDARSFAVGDTVRLRSGSPFMTVTKVMPDAITCSWFAFGPHGFAGELQSGSFPQQVLEAKSPSSSEPKAPAPVGGIRARLDR